MDALSETLNAVRMTGAVFFNAEFTAPWGIAEPHAQKIARVLAPESERLVIFHLITDGEARARAAGTEDLSLEAGDLLIVPHGDPHTVSNGSPATLIDGADWVDNFLAPDLSTARYGGGGAPTRFVCGYFGCERYADRSFLAGLPPLIKINIRGDAAGEWLENSLRHLVREAASGNPGGMVLLSKMAEVIFIEALRRYMRHLPPAQTGWLAGARDPVVGGALFLLHKRPHHPWTMAELAVELGASRSVVAERFRYFLGESPVGYLLRWRLQLATKLLQTTPGTVMQAALEVGYQSEAAFNRAFKREFGLPPAQYRRQFAGNEGRRAKRPVTMKTSTRRPPADADPDHLEGSAS